MKFKALLMMATMLLGVTAAQAETNFSSDNQYQFMRPGGPGGGGGGRGPGGPGGGRGPGGGGPGRPGPGNPGGPGGGGGGRPGPGRPDPGRPGPGRPGPGRPGPGWPVPRPGPRYVTCTAQNDWGQRFDESAYSRYEASDRALRTCEYRSRGSRCVITGCW